MSGDLRIGVDIGGTFTDVVVRRPGSPSRIMKIPTTRSDPSIAVLEALKRMQAEWGLQPQDVLRFVHGTTVATNAVLERKGAKVGVITTDLIDVDAAPTDTRRKELARMPRGLFHRHTYFDDEELPRAAE